MTELPTILLIHGAFADGSSWSTVVADLQAKGYTVTAPQFPLTSLADDVARLRQALAWQGGPTVVVGHSYGGKVMTALGDDVANAVGCSNSASGPSRASHGSTTNRVVSRPIPGTFERTAPTSKAIDRFCTVTEPFGALP